MLNLWSRLGRLLLSWSLLMMFAGAAAYGLALLPGVVITDPSFIVLIFAVGVASAIAGGIAGVVQRNYLRSYWAFSSAWAWASAFGWGVGIPLVVGISASLREPLAEWPYVSRLIIFLLAAGGCGVFSSLGQWLQLRKATRRHLWWLLANGIGWLMAWLLVLAVGFFLGGGEPLPTSLDRALDAVILGGLAGFVIGFEQSIAIIGLFSQTAWEKSRKSVV